MNHQSLTKYTSRNTTYSIVEGQKHHKFIERSLESIFGRKALHSFTILFYCASIDITWAIVIKISLLQSFLFLNVYGIALRAIDK